VLRLSSSKAAST